MRTRGSRGDDGAITDTPERQDLAEGAVRAAADARIVGDGVRAAKG